MLCDRLNDLIKLLNIKKGDFAEKINFSQAYISMILSGAKQSPSDRFYESVKREFNVNIEWLKNGSGTMFCVEESNLSTDDYDLIQKYNQLPLSERKMIDNIIDAILFKNSAEIQEESKESE